MSRRTSRSSKFHNQYLTFLRKWKSYVRGGKYDSCEQLCGDNIRKVKKSINQIKNDPNFVYNPNNGDPFKEYKSLRSKVRNLYAVLLHDYLKRHDDALDQYELCIEDDPLNASAHYNWAILYKNYYKNYKKAEQHYKEAIRLKPRHAAYHNNYGLLLEQQLKNYEEAKKRFQKALDLDPNNGRAHTNMANLLKKHYKNYEKASYHYQQAIELDPENPTRHFNYALFLKHSLRDYELAGDEYERAIELDPNYEQAIKEYKNFLLKEHPFNRKRPRFTNHNSNHINNISNNREENCKNHASRCVKVVVSSLWGKNIKEAKELLNVAIRCNSNNPFVKFLQDPNNEDTFIYHQFDHEQIQSEISRLEYIIRSKNNEITNLYKDLEYYDSKVSQINDFISNKKEITLIQAHCQRLERDLKKKIRSLSSYINQLDDDPQQTDLNTGEISDYDSDRTPTNGRKKSYRSESVKTAPLRGRKNRVVSQYSFKNKNRFGFKGKRSSVISTTSAYSLHDAKVIDFVDFQKKSLLSSISKLQNMQKSLEKNESSKIDDILEMLQGTMYALQYIEKPLGNSPGPSPFLQGMNGPGYLDETRTLGGMSTVSYTTTSAMENRRTYLEQQAQNENVPISHRAVLQFLTKTYLKKSSDDNTVLNEFNEEDEDNESLRRKFGNNSNSLTTSHEIRIDNKVKKYIQDPRVLSKLNNINTWNFDVFGTVESCGEYSMSVIMNTILKVRGLDSILKINPILISNYFLQISQLYKNNPYHNHIHGCDVLVSCHYFMNAKIFDGFRPLDVFACLVSAACHDVGHPGNNNGFECNIESDIAVQYNDISVLEMYHASKAWQTLKKPGCNILENLNKQQRKSFRKTLIDAILATDMSKHMSQQTDLGNLIDELINSGVPIDSWKSKSSNNDNDSENSDSLMDSNSIKNGISDNNGCEIYDDKIKLAQILIPLTVHTADLSNPAKPSNLYLQWADRVMNEFWNQGDSEKKKKIAVTKICDREITDKPTCQTGFINHVIKPWFDLWAKLLVDDNHGELYLSCINNNFNYMKLELEKIKLQKEEEKQNFIPQNTINNNNNNNNNNNKYNNNHNLNNNIKTHGLKDRYSNNSNNSNNNNNNINNNNDIKEEEVEGNTPIINKSVSVLEVSYEDIAKIQMKKKIEEMQEMRKQEEMELTEIDGDNDLSSLRYNPNRNSYNKRSSLSRNSKNMNIIKERN